LDYDNIDIKQTMKYKKIIARTNWFNLITDNLINFTLFLAYPMSVIVYIYVENQNGKAVSVLVLINLVFSILFAYSLFYALHNTTRFKIIEALEITKNRELIDKLIVQNKWIQRRKTKTLLVASPKWDFFSFNWGRQFSFLFEKNNIYINVVSFGRFDMVSPFHWFADRQKERQIKKAIIQLINEEIE